MRTSAISVATVLAVATGGALGATARFLVQWTWERATSTSSWAGFPGATIVVNVVGCFLLAWWTASSWSQADDGGVVRAFVATGALGAFTTFSTFGLDGWRLVLEGRHVAAAGYLAATVATCAVAVVAGWSAGLASRA